MTRGIWLSSFRFILKLASKFPCIKTLTKIGLGFGFSPTLEALLAEAKILAETFSAGIVLLHAGKPSVEQQEFLKYLIQKHNLYELGCKVIFQEGNAPVTIAKMAEAEKVDLLITGALKKETFRKYYFGIGSIARNLARHAQNSVLLIPDPSIPPCSVKQIVISVHEENPEKVIESGLLFAQKLKVEKIHIVKESTIKGSKHVFMRYYAEKDYYRMHEQIMESEHKFIKKLLEPYMPLDINLTVKVLFGHSGIALVEYSKQVNADLLVDAYPEFKAGFMDRLFPHDIEYALKDLPCKLLLVN